MAQADYTLATLSNGYSGQSVPLWSNQSDGHTRPWIFLGPHWDLSNLSLGGITDLKTDAVTIGAVTFPAVDYGRTGAAISFGGSGALGFKFRPYYDGGTMDFTYNVGVNVVTNNSLPSRGKPVSVWTTTNGNSGSTFSTTTPQVGVGVAATFALSGHANYDVAAFGHESSGQIFSPFNWNLKGSSSQTANINEVISAKTTLNPIYDKDLGSGFRKYMDSQSTKSKNCGLPSEIIPLTNDLTKLVNQAITQANPLPVGASISLPDLSASSSSVGLSSTLSSRKWSPFLTISTDFLSWVSFLCGGGDLLTKIASNSLILEGPQTDNSNLTVSWDFCKAYADLTFGLKEDISLAPNPTIELAVFNRLPNGQLNLLTSGSGTLSFNYPNEGTVEFHPTIKSMSFDLSNNFSWGIGGDIGITPIDFKAKGRLGPSDTGIPVDVSFDPATEQWTGTPSTWIIKSDKVSLPMKGNTSLGTVPFLPINNDVLPPKTFGGSPVGGAPPIDGCFKREFNRLRQNLQEL